MSVVPAAPNPPAPPPKRYAWEEEETFVQKRRGFRYRLRRLFTNRWRLKLAIILVILALSSAEFMRAILPLLGTILRFVLVAFAIMFQFIALFWFMAKTRQYTIMPGSSSGVSFKDYRGHPEVLEQARQIVKLLRGVRVFEEAGGEPLNGLLLEGPPGTGKTWLAQAIATEAGVPFFAIDGSSLQSMFVGVAPMKIARLYSRARKAARQYGAAVVFIDEIDSVGSRGGVAQVEKDSAYTRLPIFMGMGGQMLLPTLLIEMSGFSLEHGWRARLKTWFYRTFLRRNPPKPNKRVLTIGATNRISALDPALLRPGRFDKKIRIDAPDMEGRRDLFEYYLGKMSHDGSIDPLVMASETPFYTPADIKYLLNEALRLAMFDGRAAININDIRRAQPEHEFGTKMPIRNMTLADKRRLAAHESGHAIAVRLFKPDYRIARITIIRQGGAHGYVRYYPATEDYDYINTYETLMSSLRVAVAGKAGEIEFCGENAQTLGVGIGWGDPSDFGQIRLILYRMANAGMFGQLGGGDMISDENIPPETRQMMDEVFRTVLSEVRLALRMHHEMGNALINLLMEKEELLAGEVEEFFNQYGLYTPKVLLPQETGDIVTVNEG